ncbi:uncharacterized protein LOC26526164 [Drosophila erecta]|uniref:Uncharacterized protein n=1 Tax=Drosophila erecta TaxID=7220 RepID=A0A0Q5VYL6_DROER|nr:uncharacterized protein LOC26526164 [Drosophila erecta]KQS62574.1 uncharacterized protein Dere_GG26340 [Drosophila erecta]
MPEQQTVYKCNRCVMVLLRSYLSVLYLWGILHLAAIMPFPHEIWETTFWSRTRSFKVAYRTILNNDLWAEVYILTLILVVLCNLFYCCHCRLVGVRILDVEVVIPPLQVRLLILPIVYIVVFVFCWTITTITTCLGVVYVTQGDGSVRSGRTVCLLVVGLLMKLLALANFYSICIRTWAYLKILDTGANEWLVNYYNFGDHLNLFFRV